MRPVGRLAPQRFEEVQFVEQACLYRRFAPGQYQPVLRVRPVTWVAHLECLHSYPLQHAAVFDESPLEG